MNQPTEPQDRERAEQFYRADNTTRFFGMATWDDEMRQAAWQFAEAYAEAARSEERKRTLEVGQALRELMEAVVWELTGTPKNVPKSNWARQWDKAESVLAALKGE